MTFTVIVPFFNGHATIERLLDSIPTNISVIVVDDMSDVPYQSNRPNVITVRMQKKGYFTGACNLGIQMCKDDILILNQDTWFTQPNWLQVISEQQDYYAMIGEGIAGVHPAWPNGYIHGTFMYVRRDLINTIGLMNAEVYPLWGSTCEWQLRACRAGYEVLPIKRIHGFNHERREEGQYTGSSIRTILEREPDNKHLLIRTPPEVSVIVPTYNHGRYLEDMISSLLGGETSLGYFEPQSFQSFEVIIVDDASTDNTQQIAEALVDPWKGIRYIRRDQNGGTAASINTGIKASYGKYITILGADDMREPWSLEVMYQKQIKNLHSFVYDSILAFGGGTRRPEVKVGVSPYDFDKLLKRNHVHAGIMFPIQAWHDIGGYPETMRDGREDWAVNIALGVKGYCGVYIPEKGYLYRRELQNRTLTNTTPGHHRNFLQQLYALFPSIYQGERPMGCCGGRKSKVIPTTAAAAITQGAGMTLIKYVGSSWGKMTWYGPVSGKPYVAGLKSPIVNADPRDLITGKANTLGMLEINENGKPVFQVFKPVTPPVQVVEKEPLPEPEVVEAEPILADNPFDYSVREVKKWNLEPDDWELVAQMELKGKNRKTILDHADRMIKEGEYA